MLRVEDGRAEVLDDGVPTWVAVHGIADLAAGEYVIVYAGQALERIATDEAEAVLAYLAELEQLYADLLE